MIVSLLEQQLEGAGLERASRKAHAQQRLQHKSPAGGDVHRGGAPGLCYSPTTSTLPTSSNPLANSSQLMRARMVLPAATIYVHVSKMLATEIRLCFGHPWTSE